MPLEDLLYAKLWANTVCGTAAKPSEMASIIIVSVLQIFSTCWAQGLIPALLDSKALNQCDESLEQLLNIPIGRACADCQGLT